MLDNVNKSSIDAGMKNVVHIPYKPFLFADKKHAITKASEDGKRHRYLCGVASGTNVDKHGEIMTPECIASYHEQAMAGNILLYADLHGVAYTEDIGILTTSKILENGDWYVEFRLYDESDGVGPSTKETIEKMWRQINGLPPYKKPMQKGFSIEGRAGDEDIKTNPLSRQKAYNYVKLIGAVVVPDPAYASVASAIYKSLDQTPPWVDDKIIAGFRESVTHDEISNTYYKKHYAYQEKLEDQIESIMTTGSVTNKKETLEKLFTEFAAAMIDLIMQSQTLFAKTGRTSQAEDIRYLYDAHVSDTVSVLKSMLSKTDKLILSLQKTERGTKNDTRIKGAITTN